MNPKHNNGRKERLFCSVQLREKKGKKGKPNKQSTCHGDNVNFHASQFAFEIKSSSIRQACYAVLHINQSHFIFEAATTTTTLLIFWLITFQWEILKREREHEYASKFRCQSANCENRVPPQPSQSQGCFFLATIPFLFLFQWQSRLTPFDFWTGWGWCCFVLGACPLPIQRWGTRIQGGHSGCCRWHRAASLLVDEDEPSRFRSPPIRRRQHPRRHRWYQSHGHRCRRKFDIGSVYSHVHVMFVKNMTVS